MTRRIRKRSGTGIYHVMLRGINRQDIFEDDEDYRQMIGLLHTLTERRDENGLLLQPLCTFYAYCLMSNHVHLLIRERAETISEVVKKLGIAYAYYFNITKEPSLRYTKPLMTIFLCKVRENA